MNYLAHLFLADSQDPPATEQFLVGNLLGDFVKGRLDQSALLNHGAARCAGMILHRAVDSYTDQHPIVRKSMTRLSPDLRRFGGIVIDLFFDHFLACHWSGYCALPLTEFCPRVYAALQNHYHSFPTTMQRSVAYMIRNDSLRSYQRIEGVEMALSGIERKFPRPVSLTLAVADLQRHYAEFEQDFDLFFPQLIAYTNRRKMHLQDAFHD